jgi:hypothetical protein
MQGSEQQSPMQMPASAVGAFGNGGMPMDAQLMVFPAGGGAPYPADAQQFALCSGGGFMPPGAGGFCMVLPEPAAQVSDGTGDGPMPTYNGFIHFKDARDFEDSDVEEAPVARRPRANSH